MANDVTDEQIEAAAQIISPNCMWGAGYVNSHVERRRENARVKARAVLQAAAHHPSGWHEVGTFIASSEHGVGVSWGDLGQLGGGDKLYARTSAPQPEEPAVAHSDDLAVDRFAAAMKSKLAQKRAEGRGGWNEKGECNAEHLSQLLREHVDKGDPLDVGNLAMMLHQRGESVASPTAIAAWVEREADRNMGLPR